MKLFITHQLYKHNRKGSQYFIPLDFVDGYYIGLLINSRIFGGYSVSLAELNHESQIAVNTLSRCTVQSVWKKVDFCTDSIEKLLIPIEKHLNWLKSLNNNSRVAVTTIENSKYNNSHYNYNEVSDIVLSCIARIETFLERV